METLIAEDSFLKKSDPDYDLFLNRYRLLKNGKIDFFIGYVYYDEERFGSGYSYLSLKNCELNGHSIFELRNRNKTKPNYAIIFINESEELTPEKITQWMELLSKELFLENLQIQFANIPSEKEVLNAYKTDKSIIHE